jgi:F-type H+-transporting ATPase subunit b
MLDPSLLLIFADDNPMAWTPLPAFTGIGVFLIAFIVLWWKVWPVITKGLDDRNDKILSEIEAAEDARRQAKEAQASLETEITKARAEAQETIANARAEGERLFEEMKSKNERELAERISRANADIEAARKAAVADLHAQAVDLATSISSRILQREISAGDQERLIEESLRELDATGV